MTAASSFSRLRQIDICPDLVPPGFDLVLDFAAGQAVEEGYEETLS